jgi:hypothetical protein
MNLYIQIENGQPVNHPAFEDNLMQAFGSIPSNWVPFNRIQQPTELLTSPFQTALCTYALSSDGVTWEDVWTAVEMTDAEKSALIAERQAKPPGPNVTLNTTTLFWEPNTPKPTDGQKYYWNYQTGAWVEIPATPSA